MTISRSPFRPGPLRGFLHRAPRLLAPLVLLLLLVTPAAAQVDDLLISEYVEGNSNNKAIEIYNGTDFAVDLEAEGYRLEIYFDDNDEVPLNVIDLDGDVDPGGTWVVTDDNADPPLLALADQPASGNFFNGNDSIVLRRGADGPVVDSFGKLGDLTAQEPQWSEGGVSTQEHTLRRMPDVCRGDTDPNDPFDPSLQWVEFPQNTFDGLGSHLLEGCRVCSYAEPTPTAVLDCDSATDSGSNDDPGSTRQVDAYPCLASSYRGREVLYAFEPPADGTYGVALTGLTGDLDLVVIGLSSCSCSAASGATGSADEELSFTATASTDNDYLIFVDGAQGTISDYTLELTCPSSPTAAFTLAPEFPTAREPTSFFDTSEGEPSTWSWDFGDGATSEARNPRHTYAIGGSFDVTLTVANAFGMSSTDQRIEVAPGDAVVAITGPASGEVDTPLTFVATASGCSPDPAGWVWTTAGGEVTSGDTTGTLGLRWPAGGRKVFEAANSACGSARGSHSVEIAPRQAPAPPAPTGLAATPLSATEIRLSWVDNSSTEDGFAIERQRLDGAFSTLDLVPANTTSAAVSVAGTPEPTANPSTFRVKAFNTAGSSAPTGEASTSTVSDSCESATSLCLLRRFRLEAEWRDFEDHRGVGHPVQLTSDSGYFWFFGPDNVELAIKVLDGLVVNGHFWVYYGALSNVEFTVTVTDTETGNTRVYFNPAGVFASVGDTEALPPAGSGLSLTDNDSLRSADPGLPAKRIGVDFDWSPDRPATADNVLFADRSQTPPVLFDRTWDFGDGTGIQPAPPMPGIPNVTITHRFAAAGTFDVTLQVLDLSGDFFRSETRTRRVEVTPPVEPRINLSGPPTVRTGVAATFGAAADEHCSPLHAQGWLWEVSGGIVRAPGDGATIDVRWNTPGTKRVRVRNSGCNSVFASRTIEVGAGPPPPACVPGPEVLCLRDGRFRVTATWVDFDGNSGPGQKVRLTDETGQFWFFNENNVELVLKVADGQALNNHFWVFYGALSNVGFTITVTDTETGNSKRYVNPPGDFVSVGDTSALPGD